MAGSSLRMVRLHTHRADLTESRILVSVIFAGT
jgi:hypothetical protein